MKTRNRIAVFAASLGVLAGAVTAGLAGPAAAADLPNAGRVELCTGSYPAEFQHLNDDRNETLRVRIPAGVCRVLGGISPERTALSIHVNALTNVDPNVPGQVNTVGTLHGNPSLGLMKIVLNGTFGAPGFIGTSVDVAR
jgi:hypothetical protein